MNFFMVSLALCILVSERMVLGYGSLVIDQDQPSQRCKASKALSLIQIDCSGRVYKHIPDHLDSSIQVLVFTNNRIKKLPAGSFSRYSSLKYLYLGQNVLSDLTQETIDELSGLEVLDLSENVLEQLPPGLFQLSYLRKLYLTENELKENTFETSVTSPLEFLDVSNNQLKKVPAIGHQPRLTFLNLSMNAITQVSVEDLAPFCSLKTLDLRGNRIQFDSTNCDCYHFNAWVNIRNLSVIPTFSCNEGNADSCSKIPFTNTTTQSFGKCLDLIKIQAAAVKAKKTWIIAGCCGSALVVCLLIGLYCLLRRNNKRNRRLKEEQKLAVNNANTELLNGNLADQLPIKTLHE